MLLYAISDLHLGAKPSPYFKHEDYEDQKQRIRFGWIADPKDDAIIFVVGDISDRKPLHGLEEDYKFLDSLPGQKILVPGNHDDKVWDKKIEKFCQPYQTLTPMKSGVLVFEKDRTIVGFFKGAYHPQDQWFNKDVSANGDKSPLKRWNTAVEEATEVIKEIREKRKEYPEFKEIILTHYSPFIDYNKPSPLVDLFEDNLIKEVAFGHYHDKEKLKLGEQNSIFYQLLSAPYRDYMLALIP